MNIARSRKTLNNSHTHSASNKCGNCNQIRIKISSSVAKLRTPKWKMYVSTQNAASDMDRSASVLNFLEQHGVERRNWCGFPCVVDVGQWSLLSGRQTSVPQTIPFARIWNSSYVCSTWAKLMKCTPLWINLVFSILPIAWFSDFSVYRRERERERSPSIALHAYTGPGERKEGRHAVCEAWNTLESCLRMEMLS